MRIQQLPPAAIAVLLLSAAAPAAGADCIDVPGLYSLLEPGALRLVLSDRHEPPGERDRAMAERVAEAAEVRPGDFVVVPTGNLHNRLTKGMPWDGELEPMGYRLTRLRSGARIVSLDMAHPGGTAWVCYPGPPRDCGVKELA